MEKWEGGGNTLGLSEGVSRDALVRCSLARPVRHDQTSSTILEEVAETLFVRANIVSKLFLTSQSGGETHEQQDA